MQPRSESVSCLSPVTGVIQVLTVAAAGCYMAALSESVHILAAAQGLLLLQDLVGSLLHDGQPDSLSDYKKVY